MKYSNSEILRECTLEFDRCLGYEFQHNTNSILYDLGRYFDYFKLYKFRLILINDGVIFTVFLNVLNNKTQKLLDALKILSF